MESGSYSFFDHTADIGIELEASSPEALYQAAARALFELVIDTREIETRVERIVKVVGEDHAELLVRWLAELLYLHETEGLLFSRFEVTEVSTGALSGLAAGEPYDPRRHHIKTELKAVTYHQASVRNDDGVWRGRVVVDV